MPQFLPAVLESQERYADYGRIGATAGAPWDQGGAITSRRHRPGKETPPDAGTAALIQMCKACLASLARHELPSAQATAAWNELVRRYDCVIRRFMGRIHLQSHDLDDRVQEVWLAVANRLPDLDYEPDRGQFETWLYTVARSKVIDAARKRKGHRLTHLRARMESERSGRAWHAAELERRGRSNEQSRAEALEKLRHRISTQDFRIIEMHWVERRPIREIAETLRVSSQAVYARERRAREKLKRLINAAVESRG